MNDRINFISGTKNMPLNTDVFENGMMVGNGSPVDMVENISRRSEYVQEIITRRPGFLERWAILVFLLILMLIFAGSWFIKYPDIVLANAILTAANAPKEIVIRQDGKLINLFVDNENTVVKDQAIGWIESTADHSEVLKLSALLDKASKKLNENETELVSSLFKNEFRNLGELQTSFQQFFTSLQQFNDYLVNGYYYKRKRNLFQDYDYLKKMHTSLSTQISLAQQDLMLTQEEVEANNTLLNEKVISKQDFRNQKSKLVSKQLSIPQYESSLLTNENLQISKQKEIDELEHTISQQKDIFQQALQTLKSLTVEWVRKYIIKAPISGKIVFIVPLQENQFVQSGKTIGFINPSDSRFYAQINLQQFNFGKVDTGQEVQLRFDAYPYEEFGYIPGKLKYISRIPSDSGFLATIELPNGLLTNFRKNLQYRSGLKSQALIVTKEIRLLNRFYSFVRKGTSVK